MNPNPNLNLRSEVVLPSLTFLAVCASVYSFICNSHDGDQPDGYRMCLPKVRLGALVVLGLNLLCGPALAQKAGESVYHWSLFPPLTVYPLFARYSIDNFGKPWSITFAIGGLFVYQGWLSSIQVYDTWIANIGIGILEIVQNLLRIVCGLVRGCIWVIGVVLRANEAGTAMPNLVEEYVRQRDERRAREVEEGLLVSGQQEFPRCVGLDSTPPAYSPKPTAPPVAASQSTDNL